MQFLMSLELLDDVFGNEPDLKDCLAILKQNNETLETISSKSTKEFIEMGITLLGHQKKLIRLSRDALQRSKSDHSDVKTEDSHSVQ